MKPEIQQTITARGHENVTACHASTFEVTTEEFLTPAGDCIIAIGADRAPTDFSDAFVDRCRSPDATITATIVAGGVSATVEGQGTKSLTFDDDTSAVFRTSEYVDDRTVMINATAAAGDLDGDLIDQLAQGATAQVTLSVSQ